MADVAFTWGHTAWLATPERALYAPDEQTLLVADLHFGKAAHFRKHGYSVPQQAELDNLSRLDGLINRLSPRHLVLAGDAFHSQENRSIELFKAWRERHPTLAIQLVQGNHDVMGAATYPTLGIEPVGAEGRIGPVRIMHDPAHCGVDPEAFYLAGHVHPAVKLPGNVAGLGLTLPALVLGPRIGMLPSFGAFTGSVAVERPQGGRAFVFGDGRVFEVP